MSFTKNQNKNNYVNPGYSPQENWSKRKIRLYSLVKKKRFKTINFCQEFGQKSHIISNSKKSYSKTET